MVEERVKRKRDAGGSVGNNKEIHGRKKKNRKEKTKREGKKQIARKGIDRRKRKRT